MQADNEVVSRLDVGRDAWDTFVDGTDEAWLWHRFDIHEALGTWLGRTDRSVAFLDGGTLVAVLPIHVLTPQLFRWVSRKRLDCLGGLAMSPHLNQKQRSRLREQATNHLMKFANQEGAIEITVSISPMTPFVRGTNCPLTSPLLPFGFEDTPSSTWVVDLSSAIETIRADYSELTRRQLRKASAVESQLRLAQGSADLETYYALHCDTYRRSGAPPHPRAYFEHIFNCFIPGGLSRIVFLERDGVVIAAQNTAIYKKAAFYWTGASSDTKHPGDNRLLFDDQIAHCKKAGCEWYEVGEAAHVATDVKQRGLSDFKRGFGSALFPYFKGRLITARKKMAALEFGKAMVR